jgi:hypothetical protein
LGSILIDYESIQPPDRAGFHSQDLRVPAFVGTQQNCIRFDVANAVQ